ncbi:D-cysteine desulfhydrase family protein [candidate division KSB1 bacterium]
MARRDKCRKEFTRRKFLERTLMGGIGFSAAPAILSTLISCGTTRTAARPGSLNPSALNAAISGNFQRRKIAHTPTPLEEMKALSSELGGPKLYMKRDDQTGLAFGGNKTRKLEYIIPDVLDKKADMIITYAGVQSNWCRQTAAAAKMYGIKPVLVLSKNDTAPAKYDGNLLLDEIFGAEIEFVEPSESREEVVDRLTEEALREGHKPYIIPVGGSQPGGSMLKPFGAVSYAHAFLELYTEARERDVEFDCVVHPTGSGGTQAGLVVGALAVDPDVRIVGISVGGSKQQGMSGVAGIAGATADALNLDMPVAPDDIIVFDEYVGDGYGVLNQDIVDAIRLTARAEGILLDPVYTGKAMAGMIDLVRKGYFKKSETVVFLHTGGTPALFPYKEQIMEYIRNLDAGIIAPDYLPF